MTPNRFREELKRFDKSLDIVYNGMKSRWEIIGIDRKGNKYLIRSFSLGQVGTLGIDTIKEMAEVSPGRHQSAREVNERLDRLVKEDNARDERAMKDAIESRLEDSWIRFQYASGTRISFATMGAKEEPLRITDKRRFIDSPSGE